MLTQRELERMQAEAEQKIAKLYQEWYTGFLGKRVQPKMMQPIEETDGNVQRVTGASQDV